MKNRNIIKFLSFAMIVWYVLCVMGFDIHTCRHSGKTYMVSLVAATECADIHPDMQCNVHSADCHCDDVCKDGCCSDDIKVLSLTGTERNQDSTVTDVLQCSQACFLPHDEASAEAFFYGNFYYRYQDLLIPDSLPDILASYSIFRI